MLSWNDSLLIGVERIDTQHKIFLNLVNEFEHAYKTDSDTDRLVRILREVDKYAEYHFLSEENLMQDVAFPEIERHRILHRYLLTQAQTKLHELELGVIHPRDIVAFLYDWFILHIQNEDHKIAAYCHPQS